MNTEIPPVPAITHADANARDYASRYAADTLPAGERASFEVHLLECERCRADVELAAGVRSVLARVDATPSGAQGARRRVPGRRVVWWSGLAAAAVIAVVGTLIARGDSDRARLRALGALSEAPMYLGVAVRAEGGGASGAAAQFDSAMAAYNRGEYARAAQGLRAALDAGSPAAPTNFFLGASLLMLDRRAEARDAFTRVIDDGESPYWHEARLYRAKSELRIGDARAARADLEILSAPDSPAPLRQAARDLLAQLDGVPKP